jgi:hypothetical protein
MTGDERKVKKLAKRIALAEKELETKVLGESCATDLGQENPAHLSHRCRVSTRVQGDGFRGVERRAPTLAQFEVNPSPRKLRDSLKRADEALASVEDRTRRRVARLLAEVIGRSSDPRRTPHGLIQIAFTLTPTTVRIDVSGPALLLPSEVDDSQQDRTAVFPAWILQAFADRWALDRRRRDAAMWFLLARSRRGEPTPADTITA